MRVDLHTHVVPPRWDDFASRYGGGKWPRLVVEADCRGTLMTGDQFFEAVDSNVHWCDLANALRRATKVS